VSESTPELPNDEQITYRRLDGEVVETPRRRRIILLEINPHAICAIATSGSVSTPPPRPYVVTVLMTDVQMKKGSSKL
jgi:hypothetical protein